MWDQASETADLLSIEDADFRQESEYQCCCDGPEAGDRAQDLSLALQGFVGPDMTCNLGIQFGELLVDEAQARLGLDFEDRIDLHMAAVEQTTGRKDLFAAPNFVKPSGRNCSSVRRY